MDLVRRIVCAGAEQRGLRPRPARRRGAAGRAGGIAGRAALIAFGALWLAAGAAAAEPAGGSGESGGRTPAAGVQGSSSGEGRATAGVAAEALAARAMLAEITAWIAGNFELPAAAEAPRIVLVPAGEMARVRFHVLLERRQGEGAVAKPMEAGRAAPRQIVAFYDDGSRTIYLPETWRSGDPREVSVLVHEVVHHLQHMAGLKYACAQAREQLAFAAQEKWLALSGLDLESAFRMNRMTILLRTRCWH